jgi:phosphoserine phosphatase
MTTKYTPMAIAYDFDGTLAPGNMQEHQFIPDIKMTAKKFWSEVKNITQENQADEVLVFMNLMLEKARTSQVPVGREDFKKHGKTIKLFDGVEEWFDRITAYARSKGVHVEHFLISSGNAEIFAGTSIAKKYNKVYASKYMFDANGVPAWPALAVNYTTKTQYLFRINKNAHDLSDNAKVNEYIEKSKRPIPFENMVFIGDGATDIPCFRLIKEKGGLSIAVYKANTKGASDKAKKYLEAGRVHCVLPALYKEGDKIDTVLKARIDYLAARGSLNKLFK